MGDDRKEIDALLRVGDTMDEALDAGRRTSSSLVGETGAGFCLRRNKAAVVVFGLASYESSFVGLCCSGGQEGLPEMTRGDTGVPLFGGVEAPPKNRRTPFIARRRYRRTMSASDQLAVVVEIVKKKQATEKRDNNN